jgi:hypothetical protein
LRERKEQRERENEGKHNRDRKTNKPLRELIVKNEARLDKTIFPGCSGFELIN